MDVGRIIILPILLGLSLQPGRFRLIFRDFTVECGERGPRFATVAFYLLYRRDNVLGPMITGSWNCGRKRSALSFV